MSLLIDRCSFKAAKYAVENFHYSRRMPSAKLVHYGVWEDHAFTGAVIFGRGANNNMLKPYGLKVTEGCELVRIALSEHRHTVTQIVSICLRLLKKENPGLRLVVSYSDSRQNHLGKIYQAGNWIYTGVVRSTPEYFINGRWRHQRYISAMGWSLKTLPSNIRKKDGGNRYKYLYPLDKETREQITKLSKQYPKELRP